jgi:hypothetical protein
MSKAYMGEHIDLRGPKKFKKIKEHNTDARHNRITFKRYLRDLEEELLDLDLEATDPVEEPNQDE